MGEAPPLAAGAVSCGSSFQIFRSLGATLQQ